MTAIEVFLDTPGGHVTAGIANITRTRGTTTTRFTYATSYLAGPGWELGPDLPVITGEGVTEGLPGALDDSAPDAWGRNLITRRLARDAARAGHPAPAPTEVDFLLGVSDHTRQGALRFSLDGDQLLAVTTEVPRLVDLARLLEAATKVASGLADADDAVSTLLDAGSGSLGGARPKASITDGAVLAIAKFPHPDDRWDVMRWEAAALDLAGSCGITVPPHRLEVIGTHSVLIVERFDRRGRDRVPFLSARSMIDPTAGAGDYLELVDAIADHGSDVAADLVELWRRIAFSIAINNTDDHLRNHAFLRDRGGWKLSPAFDLNPNPDAAAARATSLAGETSSEGCQRALFAVADRFGISEREAEGHWKGLMEGVARWRDIAVAHEIGSGEREMFSRALDRWTTSPSPSTETRPGGRRA